MKCPRSGVCRYHISLKHEKNNTISRLTITDSAFAISGIKVTILRAYYQPQLHLDDFFIKLVGRLTEAYLAPASRRNSPTVGEIGTIQANSSYTKHFIFDPHISSCDFFRIHCGVSLHRMLSQHYLCLRNMPCHYSVIYITQNRRQHLKINVADFFNGACAALLLKL